MCVKCGKRTKLNTECDSTVFWRESNRYGVSAWDGLLLVLRIHVTAGRQDLINTLLYEASIAYA